MGCGSSLPNIPYDERTQDVFESGADPNGERKRRKKGNKRILHSDEFNGLSEMVNNVRGGGYNVNVPKKKQKKERMMFNNNTNNFNNNNNANTYNNANNYNHNFSGSSNTNFNANTYNNNNSGGIINNSQPMNNSNNNNATPLMNSPLPINNNINNNNSNPKKKYKYKYTINQNIPGLIEENVTKTPNSLPFQFYIIQNIKAHTQSVTCLIELQNQSMASCSLDKTIKLWGKANSGEFILYRTYEGHTEGVMAIREMPEFKALCSCSIDKCIKIWELRNTTCIATLKGHTMPVIAIDYSSSLKFIFSGSDDLTVRIWNATDHKTVKVIKDNQQSVTAVLYVDPFAYLVTGSDDKMLKFYNGKNNFEWVKTIDTLLSEIVCLKYAGSRVLASCQDGNVFFINIKFLKRIRSVKFSNDAVHDFFVMDHDTFLVTGGTDCKGRVWKVGSGERTVLSGHSREINGIILLSDGRIASASADKTILVWVADQKNEDEGNGGGGGDEDEYEEG